MYLAVGSDNLFWLLGLQDDFGGDNAGGAGTYVTDATVTATVLNPSDLSTLATVSMSYVSGSVTVDGDLSAGGNYRGQLAYSVALVEGTQYPVDVVVVSGSNELHKRLLLVAQYDGAT